MDHNSFFKITFQNRENAIDFLRHKLPQELLKDILLDSLEITKDSFVDANYQDVHSDMLFKVPIAGKDSYIYLLLEHKSYPDKMTSFQLLKYMLGIWSLHVSQEKKEKSLVLPLILPVLLYHGKNEWQYGNNFQSIQEMMPGWEKYQVNFSYIVYDFSRFQEEDIKGEITTRLFTLLLKYINREEFEEKLVQIISLLAELAEKKTGMEYIETVLLYMLSGVKKIELDSLKSMMETKESRRVKDMLVSLLDKIEQKGYDRALHLVEIAKRRAEDEKRRAEDEKRRAELAERKAELAERKAERAERKKALRTALHLQESGSELAFIVKITELDEVYLQRFFKITALSCK
ncbi:MAG: Rpn family recombination-promoting nuclease/putative transposase [Leptospiraceae bacterium]|nr:Rpn family recombination-promoting nuclease/putative transposase [Leptospiraceae bacterium]